MLPIAYLIYIVDIIINSETELNALIPQTQFAGVGIACHETIVGNNTF